MNDEESVIRKLTGPPWLLTRAEAVKCVADGTASLMLNSSAKPFNADGFAAARRRVSEAWNRELAGDAPAAVATADEIATAQAESYTHAILPSLTLGAPAEPPDPPAPVAQNSEPERVRYFVCKVCLGAFAATGTGAVVACECGAARFGDDGVRPFSEMRIPLCTSAAIEVTALVECGKLVVAVASGGKALLAAVNRNRRNAEQSLPEAVAKAADAARGSVTALADYYATAVGFGARTNFHAHYHTRSSGVETGADGDAYLKKEPTGDARFCGFVIARREENEADGSLVFKPVGNCARCGGDHKQPLPFWKLTRPVHEWPSPDNPGAVIATHFAYCPSNGEPIMMVSSEPLPAAVIDFGKPADGGTVEQRVDDVQDIGGLKPVVATAITQRRIPGVTDTKEHDEGYAAGQAGAQGSANPYPAGSPAAAEWNRGCLAGRGERRGN